jgi:predicted Rossmann fold nucleotide-binding protein DprA/Smf involved in DNA uptake
VTGNEKETARKRTQMLSGLRQQHAETVKRAQELLKVQQSARKILLEGLRDGPRSAPELTVATGIPAGEVLWYLATMKKYGLVEEAGMDEDGEYYRYGLLKEASA